MPTIDDINQQQELLNLYRRNLHTALLQQAKLGGFAFATPLVLNSIHEYRDQIERIKRILGNWKVAIEDHPDDKEISIGQEPSSISSNIEQNSPSGTTDPFRDYLEVLLIDIDIQIKRRVPSTILSISTTDAASAVESPRRAFVPLRRGTEFNSSPHYYSLEDALTIYGGQLLLLGNPGSGKTVCLLNLARKAVTERLVDMTRPLPIYAEISDWDASKPQPLIEWLKQVSDLYSIQIEQQIKQGKVLLLLDGLDELISHSPNYDPRQRFMEALQEVINNRIVVTSRIQDYVFLTEKIGRKLELNGAVHLRQLTEDQIKQYLSGQLNLWTVINDDATLLELVKIPLVLELIRIGFANSPESAHILRGLQDGDLNDAVFAHYLSARYNREAEYTQQQRQSLPLTFKVVRSYLENLAYENLGSREDAGILNKQAIDKVIPHVHQDAFLDLAIRLNYLFPLGADRWRFVHLRLRDHLAYSLAILRLQHADTDVRSLAAEVLGAIGDVRAIESLTEALCLELPYYEREQFLWGSAYFDEAQVRGKAARALASIGDARAVEPLIRLLQIDEVYNVRAWAAQSLGLLGDSRAIEPLIVALRDPDYEVRECAAAVLGRFRDHRAIEPLTEVLGDERTVVQSSAISSLREIGTTEALAAIDIFMQKQDQK